MRVAFDVSSVRGQKTGIGAYTESLLRALGDYAPEVTAVPLEDGAGVRQRTDRRIVREQVAIPRLARAAGADVIHLTGFAAPLRSSCPVVLTAQDLIGVLFSGNYPLASRFYWSRYLPFTLRFPRRLVTLSEHTRCDVVRLAGIPADRIRVVPPGRDEAFRPIEDRSALARARADLGLPEGFLLFVSTLEPRKGVDTLIAAYARLAAQVAEDLVLVGKRGWYWERLQTQVRQAGLERRVRFLDYVPAEQLPLVYNLARLFVFPSRYEGFGLPPLEAMACGTPVVCSNAASLPEVVGDAGVLVAPDDVDGLAGAVVQVLGDEGLRDSLRRRGERRAEGFSWRRAARETLAVYQEAVAR